MIIGNLTKLHYGKKLWLTPRHPLSFEASTFKIHYSAVVIYQARLNEKYGVLHNFELERLLRKGFQMNQEQIDSAMQMSHEEARVIDYLCTYPGGESYRYYLMMDCINVGMDEDGISEKERESLLLLARLFDVPETVLNILLRFVQGAYREQEAECRLLYRQMEDFGLGLAKMDLKYYLMTLYDTFSCTQQLLEEQKEVHLVDRCQITEDVTVKRGMKLIIDHAIVRVYGNIMLQGGELTIVHSRIIRKSDSRQSCITIRQDGILRMRDSEADCRNTGMFLSVENGRVLLESCEVGNTANGAAICSWGTELKLHNTSFHHCYSGEDGGAVLFRGGTGSIVGCRFRYCEARRGGGIYGMEGLGIGNCVFEKCYALEYGAAVYYDGLMQEMVQKLYFEGCYPVGAETVQYLSRRGGFEISCNESWRYSTILDAPLKISSQGSLSMKNITVFLNYPVQCRGCLELEGVHIVSSQMETGDMIILEHAQGCHIRGCEMDGRRQNSGIAATGTKVWISDTIFRNIKGGRAVYNAMSSFIERCIFNYCQNGGILCQGGTVKDCLFVNCRAKNGAGILIAGKLGLVEGCRFVRCSADNQGGGIDRGLGIRIVQCQFQECRPDNCS